MPLLEREAQWGRLRRAWHRSTTGETTIVLVEGAAGCGTTALLRRLADHAAAHGALILHARAPAGPRQPAHTVLRQLLHALPAAPAPTRAADDYGVPAPPEGPVGLGQPPGDGVLRQLPYAYALRGGPLDGPADEHAPGPPVGHRAPAQPSEGAAAPGQSAYGVPRRPSRALPAGAATPHRARPQWDPEDFGDAVRALARHRPVLVCVDDLQNCDGPSLEQLADLGRSLHRMPVLLALGQVLGARTPHGNAPDAAFPCHEAFDRIRVDRLSPRAATALADRHHHDHGGAPAPARLYALTGGNPLLCKTLLLEHPAVAQTAEEPRAAEELGPGGEERPAPGGPFLHAVDSCLRRSGTPARRLAEALAVLEPDASAERVAETAGITAATAAQAGDVLDAVGLTDGWRLRHPAVAAHVQETVAPEELLALRVRAARVLHAGGAGAGATARRLLHAHSLSLPGDRAGAGAGQWALPVLLEAARQALLEDDSAAAVDCLRLAQQLGATHAEGRPLGLRLAGLLRRTDPAGAENQLAEPLRALDRGELGYGDAALLARTLLTQGRIEEAGRALVHAERRRAAGESGDAPLHGLPAPSRTTPPLGVAPPGPATPGGPGPIHPGLRAATAALRPPTPSGAASLSPEAPTPEAPGGPGPVRPGLRAATAALRPPAPSGAASLSPEPPGSEAPGGPGPARTGPRAATAALRPPAPSGAAPLSPEPPGPAAPGGPGPVHPGLRAATAALWPPTPSGAAPLSPEAPGPAAPGGPAPIHPGLRAATAALWPPAPAGEDVAVVEQVLKDTPLIHGTFDLVLREIRALVHADHGDRAVVWCQKLQAEADRGRAPGWFAALGLLHAQALLRLGDVPGAQHAAAAATAAVEERGGLLLHALVAVEITAYTARGQYDEAARRLELPPPDGLFTSAHALEHLRARGHYYLATHRHTAALTEFLDAGRLARRWSLDDPRHLPWRTDAALALLHLGEHERADALITRQCALPAGRTPRAYGTALRLRAALAPAAERPRLLTRALEELRRCGDRLEHARTLADLAGALQLTGEGNRAGIIARRAWQLAADCGAQALCEHILPGRTDRIGSEGPRNRSLAPTAAEAAARLTEPEQRVAALAAFGYTNREIAAKLYVTPSTIEQHLTKIYRKLGISRRDELPLDLA
ncbi:AAA family ATPase [Streptomyces sp. NPDC093510]|uniref:AAA family ATPase n=1 Tax=Streptomyces sp. NPDC093510 TaxID=3155199 RepID=UPI00341E7673